MLQWFDDSISTSFIILQTGDTTPLMDSGYSNLLLHDVGTLCDTCCKTLLTVDAATVAHVGFATHEL